MLASIAALATGVSPRFTVRLVATIAFNAKCFICERCCLIGRVSHEPDRLLRERDVRSRQRSSRAEQQIRQLIAGYDVHLIYRIVPPS